jgi:chromosome partition protein MukF
MANDSTQLIGSLHRNGLNLELKTVDLCFLVALYARARERGLTCLDEDFLIDTFEQICELIEPGIENLRQRSTNTIHRLREQRLISRVDGAGIVRAGEYTLTTLATSIVEFFLHDEALTRESLTLLTKTLLASLGEIKAEAQNAVTEETWRSRVVAPLRITVSDLVAGIERRQRGLDAQQEEIQQDIGKLLKTDWFGAVDQCQDLLDQTLDTLAELNTVLLHDTNQMLGLLDDLEQMASASGSSEGEEAAQRVADQVLRVAAWGSARQSAWSEYYQYVHRFLRDVVRLDPSRAVSERLRNQLANWSQNAFFLVAAGSPSIRLLREVELRTVRPPVISSSRDWDRPLDVLATSNPTDEFEHRIRAALAKSPDTLSAVLREVLPHVPSTHRFVAVGWTATQVVDEASPSSDRERPWVEVPEGIEVEEWRLWGRRNDERRSIYST